MNPSTSKPSTSSFRVQAHNGATDSENRIHDDGVAAAYGFRGGLVPGVTVYGYMVPPILEQFGVPWLEHGRISVRLVAPCYEGATVVTRCDGATVTAEQEDGTLLASGAVSLAETGAPTDAWAREVYAAHPLPQRDQRPVASSQTVVPGTPLGTIHPMLDVPNAAEIPERLLHLANEILGQNFRMSPWIHAGSEVIHHRFPQLGQPLTVTGAIMETFERKGRRFAAAGLSMCEGSVPSAANLVASVRHTFIYDLG